MVAMPDLQSFYKETANNRTSANEGCPYCSKRRVSDLNRLLILKPEIAALLHPTKNGDSTADDLSVSSDKKIYFMVSSHKTELEKYIKENK